MYLGDTYSPRSIAAAFGQAAVEEVKESRFVLVRSGQNTYGLVNTGPDDLDPIIGFSIDQSVFNIWIAEHGSRLFTEEIRLQVVAHRGFFEWLLNKQPVLNLANDRLIYDLVARQLAQDAD